jgi:hypothetical protein
MENYYVGLLPDAESHTYLSAVAEGIAAAYPKKNGVSCNVIKPLTCLVAGPFAAESDDQIVPSFRGERLPVEVLTLERGHLGIRGFRFRLLLVAGTLERLADDVGHALEKFVKSPKSTAFPPLALGASTAPVAIQLPHIDLAAASTTIFEDLFKRNDNATKRFWDSMRKASSSSKKGKVTFGALALFRSDKTECLTIVAETRFGQRAA